MKLKPEIAIFLLALVVVALIGALLLSGKAVPNELWALAVALIGGGLGITVPGQIAAVSATQTASAPVSAPVASQPAATAPVAPLATTGGTTTLAPVHSVLVAER